ncbi:MAG: hypothetical protein KDE58_42570, partial [Caldilineaceae bacterium]|nr:hypothetical protein [Caldilineaceae bacterium]
MDHKRESHLFRHVIFLVLLMVLLVLTRFTSSGRDQERTCRDTGNLTVCADRIYESSSGFMAQFEVTIAPQNGEPVLLITDYEKGIEKTVATFYHFDPPLPEYGVTDWVEGQLQF